MITLIHNEHGQVQFNNYKEFSNWCKVHGFKVSHMYKDGVGGWTRITKRKAKMVLPTTESEVTYETIKSDVLFQDDDRCCSVVSMATALQIPFEKAQAYLKRCGRKHRRGANMITIKDAYIKAGHILAKNYEYNDHSMTIAQACRKFNEGTHVLLVRGHILTIINGVPHDWTKTNSRHRVQTMYTTKVIRK